MRLGKPTAQAILEKLHLDISLEELSNLNGIVVDEKLHIHSIKIKDFKILVQEIPDELVPKYGGHYPFSIVPDSENLWYLYHRFFIYIFFLYG